MSYTIQVSRKQLERIKNGLQYMDTIDPATPGDPDMIEYLYGCTCDTLACAENETVHGWNI